jgi:hypothetical protein
MQSKLHIRWTSDFDLLSTTMSATKKRKISGLSGLELDLALTQLRQLRSSAIVEEVPESDAAPVDTFTDQLDSMITALESRVNSPLVRPLFSYFVYNVSLLLVPLVLGRKWQSFGKVQHCPKGCALPHSRSRTSQGN